MVPGPVDFWFGPHVEIVDYVGIEKMNHYFHFSTMVLLRKTHLTTAATKLHGNIVS